METNDDDINMKKIFDKMLKQREDENRVKQLRENFAMSKQIKVKSVPKSILEHLKTFFVIIFLAVSTNYISQ
jgi:hypothetical protein